MKSLLFVLPVSAVLLAGCATTGAGTKVKETVQKAAETVDDATVTGDWELRFITKGGQKQEMTAATMTVTDSGNNKYTLTGFAGVNDFSTSITIGFNGAIEVSDKIATTRMSGSAEQMSAENAFLDTLKAVTSWKALKVGTETLEMKGADTTLVFNRLKITDRIWNLSAQADEKGSAVVSLPEGGRKVTLMINDKGTAHIFTGLNITDAECKIDEASHTLSMSMGNSAMTLASGSPEEMKTEQLYIKNLDAVASYTVSGKTLTVLDGNGKTVLVFSAQDLL